MIRNILLTRRLPLWLIAVTVTVVCTPADAEPIVFRFDGITRTAAIQDVPIFINQSFEGIFSYDSDAELVEQIGNRATYNDPSGTIQIEFDDIAFRSVGGVTLTLTKISTPFFNLHQFLISADMVANEGTNEPIISISVGFSNANQFLPEAGLPTDIDSSSISGQMQITSPDIAPVGGIEPPRTGFIAGSFSNYSRVTACLQDDLRMDWLFNMAAGIRELPEFVFAGGTQSEQAMTRHELALTADRAALAVADCDFAWLFMELEQLAATLADENSPPLIAEDLASTLFDQTILLLLSVLSQVNLVG